MNVGGSTEPLPLITKKKQYLLSFGKIAKTRKEIPN